MKHVKLNVSIATVFSNIQTLKMIEQITNVVTKVIDESSMKN